MTAAQLTRPSTAPNPLRRALLFSLPGSVALASPLALVACGGGTDAPDAPPASIDPPGPLDTTTTALSIELPGAIAAAAGALQVITATGTAAIAGGSASVGVVAGGPQLVSVVDASGNTLALGWAGVGQPAISMASTASVLLHFGLGLPFLGAAARDALRARLAGQPAVAAFAAQIEAALAADRRALTAMSPAIVDACAAAADTLMPAGIASAGAAARKHAQGLIVDPAVDQSGLQVVQGDVLNSVFVDNTYVRRAVVVVNREGWVDANGQDVIDPNAPVQVGEVMELPLPTAIDTVANVVGGWANEYYAPDNQNGFWRSVSDTITLDIAPEGARRTRYSVVVLTAGSLPPADPAALARLPASQRAYVEGLDLGKRLLLQMLLQDLLAPFFFEMLSSRIGAVGKNASATQQADAEVLKALAGTMLSTLQTRMPEVVQSVSEGTLDAWSAFKLILKACTFNPDTGEMSPLLQTFLSEGAQLLAKALADVGKRAAMLEIATGVQLGNRNVLGVLPVLKILGQFDAVMGKAALLRIVADANRSRSMVAWSVVATKAKVVLKPDPLEVTVGTPSYPVSVEIVDNDNDDYGVEKGSISYDWECTGTWGSLYNATDSGLSQPNRFTSSAVHKTSNYVPNGSTPDPANPDRITVRAFFEPIGSGGTRALIGSATAPIKFKQEFNLQFNPPGPTDVPVDTDFGLLVSFKENVPNGSTCAWEWSRSGVGHLTDAPADSNPAHTRATFQSGGSEGGATVTVRATLTVPAGYGKPGRIVVCDPVSTTLNAKKGLKTMTFSGGWTIDTEYTPYVCGRCGPGGTNTDETGYQVTSYVVVPKVSGAKSYSVLLEKPTPDVRGGVPFPSTRGISNPSAPSGWLDKGGSYWSGLSGASGTVSRETGAGPGGAYSWMAGRFSDMKVTVTVTL